MSTTQLTPAETRLLRLVGETTDGLRRDRLSDSLVSLKRRGLVSITSRTESRKISNRRSTRNGYYRDVTVYTVRLPEGV